MKKFLRAMTLLGFLVPTVGGHLLADDGAVVSVPFELWRAYLILVKGSIGPLKDLNLVIDTGVSSTLISPRVARRLGLDGETGYASAYGQQISVQRLILDRMKVGTVQFRRIPAIVGDFSSLPCKAGEADVLVGLSVLKRHSFSIDYRSRQLLFGSAAPFGSSSLFHGKRQLIVEAGVSGQPLNLLIDTGAEDLILFRERIRDLSGELVWTRQRRGLLHAGGKVWTRIVQLPELRLGDAQWQDIQAAVLPGSAEGYPEEIHGVLGIKSLQLSRLSLDFRQLVFSWEQ